MRLTFLAPPLCGAFFSQRWEEVLWMTVRREMPDMGCYEAILPYISGTGVLSQAPSIELQER